MSVSSHGSASSNRSGHGPGSRGIPRSDRESSILAVATTEFGRRGYQGVSVAEVARRADVSKALVLAYFGNKDALYVRCVETVAQPLLERVTDVVRTAAPGWPMAFETLRAMFESARGFPQAWALIHDATVPEGTAAHPISTGYQDAFRQLGLDGVGATLPADGDPADIDLLAEMWGSVVTSTMTWWCRHPDQTPEALVERCRRLLSALAARPGPPVPEPHPECERRTAPSVP